MDVEGRPCKMHVYGKKHLTRILIIHYMPRVSSSTRSSSYRTLAVPLLADFARYQPGTTAGSRSRSVRPPRRMPTLFLDASSIERAKRRVSQREGPCTVAEVVPTGPVHHTGSANVNDAEAATAVLCGPPSIWGVRGVRGFRREEAPSVRKRTLSFARLKRPNHRTMCPPSTSTCTNY